MSTELITTADLAKMIHLSEYTVRKLVRDGKLPAYQLNGKQYLFDPDEVLRTIKRNRVN